jgi:hypothetical protein
MQPTGTTRKLPYPLRFSEDMESVVGSENTTIQTLENWTTTDSNERVDIVLNLSLNEYLSLANTIDVGRDIAYGDNSIYIWWIWVRALKSMNLCDSIVDCVENNIDVQNAIQLITGGDPNINGNPNNWAQLAIEPVTSCDLDTTWGYTKALWNFLNQQNVDFLENLDEATNTGEQLARMMSGIPLFGLLPFDEITDWLASLGEYNLDAYNASITAAINEQIWCDLFCLAQDNNCSLTFEQIWDYFVDKFGGLNFPTLGATFAELAIYMVTGSYLNDRIVYLWTLIQLGVAFIGGRFLGTNSMNEIAIHAQTGDADNDWVLLCDPCHSPFIYERDFTVNNGGWQSDPRDGSGWSASYNTTQGWFHANNLSAFHNTAIGTDFNCTSIAIIGTPNASYNVGFYNSSGYPNNVLTATITTDSNGDGTAIVNWNVLLSYLPYFHRFGTPSYRECTYIKLQGTT